MVRWGQGEGDGVWCGGLSVLRDVMLPMEGVPSIVDNPVYIKLCYFTVIHYGNFSKLQCIVDYQQVWKTPALDVSANWRIATYA